MSWVVCVIRARGLYLHNLITTCICSMSIGYNPTTPFTILEPRDQEISEFYVVQECRAPDFEAPNL